MWRAGGAAAAGGRRAGGVGGDRGGAATETGEEDCRPQLLEPYIFYSFHWISQLKIMTQRQLNSLQIFFEDIQQARIKFQQATYVVVARSCKSSKLLSNQPEITGVGNRKMAEAEESTEISKKKWKIKIESQLLHTHHTSTTYYYSFKIQGKCRGKFCH